MTNRYYATAAYDSTRPRILASGDNSCFGATTRKLRETPLETRGIHCREYLAHDDADVIQLLNQDTAEVRKQLEAKGHEYQPWQTLGNPRAVTAVVTGVAGFFSFCSLLAFIIESLKVGPLRLVTDGGAIIIFLFFPTIYLLGKLILRFDLVKDKNNVLLNRRTGMITIPQKKGASLELPFDEFDPYLTTGTNPTGSTDFYLQLGHRYSEARVQYPPNMTEPWQAHLAWEYWQQYMDISKPLPDTPRMEPYRSRDPVTAEYDRKHQRPVDYWKNLDIDQARQMEMASVRSAAAYPWGATREQALAMGWRPSGYGEGPSTRMPSGMARMPLKKKSTEEAPPPYEQAVIESRGDFENL